MSVLYTVLYTAKNTVRSVQQLIGNTAILPSLLMSLLQIYKQNGSSNSAVLKLLSQLIASRPIAVSAI